LREIDRKYHFYHWWGKSCRVASLSWGITRSKCGGVNEAVTLFNFEDASYDTNAAGVHIPIAAWAQAASLHFIGGL
jgi:hypothetical protein